MVTDEMVEAAVSAWLAHPRTRGGSLHDQMRAALEAAERVRRHEPIKPPVGRPETDAEIVGRALRRVSAKIELSHPGYQFWFVAVADEIDKIMRERICRAKA